MPDEDAPLDLSGLELAPNWAKEIQPAPRDFPEPKGDRRGDRGGPRGPKGPRRDDRKGDGPRGPRRDGPRPGGPRGDGPRPGGGPRGDGRGKGGPPRGGGRGGPRGRDRDRDQRDNRQPQAPPLEGFKIVLEPLDPGIQYLVQQIRMTGRAYPVLDLAKLLLESRDRYMVTIKRESGNSPQLFRCKADGSAWLSREEAVRHVLNTKALEEYYDVEIIENDPPKGNFTRIAVCGMSGKLLGPPNYHGYQPTLNRIYRERFSHMDFERYKSRIKMSQDEETIEKWKEQEGKKKIFKPKGEEGVELKDRTALEQHFRDHHKDVAEEVQRATLPADAGQKRLIAGPLNGLCRSEIERQMRFPLEVMQFLFRKFETAGLKFFKKGKKQTFVTLTRPHPVPGNITLSDGLIRIMDFVRFNPGSNLNKLAGMLIPKEERSSQKPPEAKMPVKDTSESAPETEASAPVEESAATNAAPEVKEAVEKTEPVPTPEAEVEKAASKAESAPPETEAAASPEPETDSLPEATADDAEAVAEAEASALEEVAKPEAEATPEADATAEANAAESATSPEESASANESGAEAETPAEDKPADRQESAPAKSTEAPVELTHSEITILQDLRWLVREGYVIEFNNGKLFLPEERQDPPKKKRKKKKPKDSSDKPVTTEAKAEEAPAEDKPTESVKPRPEPASESSASTAATEPPKEPTPDPQEEPSPSVSPEAGQPEPPIAAPPAESAEQEAEEPEPQPKAEPKVEAETPAPDPASPEMGEGTGAEDTPIADSSEPVSGS